MTAPTVDGLEWDERLWSDVWERILNPVERHSIAMDVVRLRVPADLFEARVATELSRRWRRTARNLGLLYLLWSVFWGAIASTTPEQTTALAPVMTGLGLIAATAAWWFRWRLRRYARTGLLAEFGGAGG